MVFEIARGDMRHRLEAAAAERGGGRDQRPVVAARQEIHEDLAPRRERAAQGFEGMGAAGGDLDRGTAQELDDDARPANLASGDRAALARRGHRRRREMT